MVDIFTENIFGTENPVRAYSIGGLSGITNGDGSSDTERKGKGKGKGKGKNSTTGTTNTTGHRSTLYAIDINPDSPTYGKTYPIYNKNGSGFESIFIEIDDPNSRGKKTKKKKLDNFDVEALELEPVETTEGVKVFYALIKSTGTIANGEGLIKIYVETQDTGTLPNQEITEIKHIGGNVVDYVNNLAGFAIGFENNLYLATSDNNDTLIYRIDIETGNVIDEDGNNANGVQPYSTLKGTTLGSFAYNAAYLSNENEENQLQSNSQPIFYGLEEKGDKTLLHYIYTDGTSKSVAVIGNLEQPAQLEGLDAYYFGNQEEGNVILYALDNSTGKIYYIDPNSIDPHEDTEIIATYSVTTLDNQAQTGDAFESLVIGQSNFMPEFPAPAPEEVTEDTPNDGEQGDPNPTTFGDIFTTGQFAVSDIDSSEATLKIGSATFNIDFSNSSFTSAATQDTSGNYIIDGLYGILYVTDITFDGQEATVQWIYVLNNNEPTVQTLIEGQNLLENIAIEFIDDSSASVTNNLIVQINGTDSIITLDKGVQSDDAYLSTTIIDSGVTSTGSYIIDSDNEGNDAGRYSAGDQILYTYTVTNTGDVSLFDVTLTDDKIGVLGLSGLTDIDEDGQTDDLAVSATATVIGTYTITQDDLDLGFITNIADVSGSDLGGQTGGLGEFFTATDTVTVNLIQNTGFTVNKVANLTGDANSDGSINVGDTITYTATIVNTGNVTLTNLTFEDINDSGTPGNMADDITISGLTGITGLIDADTDMQTDDLAVGATATATYTYIIQAGQEGDTITNVATVDSDQTGEQTDDATVTVVTTATPSIDLEKLVSINGGPNFDADDFATDTSYPVAQRGDTATYTITVENDGGTPIDITNATTSSGYTVMDDNKSPSDTSDDFYPDSVTDVSGFNIGDTNDDDILDPGETWTFRFEEIINAPFSGLNDYVIIATATSATAKAFNGQNTQLGRLGTNAPDWSGDVALTSPNAQFDSSNLDLYGQVGVVAASGTPNSSVSNSDFFPEPSLTGQSMPANGVVGSTDLSGLRSEIDDLEDFLTELPTEYTWNSTGISSNVTTNLDVNGLDIDNDGTSEATDSNGDGIIVIDINASGSDFLVENSTWNIQGDGSLLPIFRVLGGSNFLSSNGDILADGNVTNTIGILGSSISGVGAVFLQAEEYRNAADNGYNTGHGNNGNTVFNFSNGSTFSNTAFYDLIIFGSAGNSNFDNGTTSIGLSNSDGDAQFISPIVNVSDSDIAHRPSALVSSPLIAINTADVIGVPNPASPPTLTDEDSAYILKGNLVEDSTDGVDNDILTGTNDNDILIGELNVAETLTGGDSTDNFVFKSAGDGVNFDTVTDFNTGEFDLIIVTTSFGGGLVTGELNASQFTSGAGITSAGDADDRFIYNTTNGDLYFDADGNLGGSSAIQIATLSNTPSLSANDIYVI